MRVLLTTDGSRGDVQPLVGLAVPVRALGAERDTPAVNGVTLAGGWR